MSGAAQILLRALVLVGAIGAGAIGAGAGWAWADDPPARDFIATLVAAHDANHSLAAARLTQAATGAAVDQARAAALPQVSATGGYGPASFHKQSFSAAADPSERHNHKYYQSAFGFALTQTLYGGGAVLAALRGAHAQAEAGAAALVQSEQQVLAGAAGAYLDLWLATRTLAVRQSTEADLAAVQAATSRQFDHHDLTVTDLGQSRTRLAAASADSAVALAALEDAREQYRLVTGLDAAAPAGLPELVAPAADLASARDLALVANPVIAQARAVKRAAEEVVEVRASGAKPKLILGAEDQQSRGAAAGVTALVHRQVGVDLTVPLSRGGAVGAAVRAARAQVEQAAAALTLAERDTVSAVEQAWSDENAARAALDSQRTAARAAALARQGVDREAERGGRTLLERLNARREQEEAALAVAQGECDLILARLRLYVAMGMMTAQGLALPVASVPVAPEPAGWRRFSDWGAAAEDVASPGGAP